MEIKYRNYVQVILMVISAIGMLLKFDIMGRNKHSISGFVETETKKLQMLISCVIGVFFKNIL